MAKMLDMRGVKALYEKQLGEINQYLEDHQDEVALVESGQAESATLRATVNHMLAHQAQLQEAVTVIQGLIDKGRT